MTIKTAFLLLSLFLYSFAAFSQDYESILATKLSKSDRYEFHLERSKKQKTQAIVAVSAGPVLTAVGAYIASKGGPTISGGGNGWITFSNRDTKGVIGASIGVFGIVTTLGSIPLFISSSKHKRQAALLVKDQPTSFVNRTFFVPSLTLNFSF